MHGPAFLTGLSPALRIAVFAAVAVAAHLLVRAGRDLVGRLLAPPTGRDRAAAEASLARRYPKAASITSLLSSAFTFVVYFLALGLVLNELGVKLTAYLASASVWPSRSARRAWSRTWSSASPCCSRTPSTSGTSSSTPRGRRAAWSASASASPR